VPFLDPHRRAAQRRHGIDDGERVVLVGDADQRLRVGLHAGGDAMLD
jgi:ATP-dependent exoDNAse (exonuclease V) alpha subunit